MQSLGLSREGTEHPHTWQNHFRRPRNPMQNLMQITKRYIPPLMPFLLIDLTLRSVTGCLEWYPIYSAAPILFSMGFGALFLCAALMPHNPKYGRVIYGAVYAVWAAYAVVQYGVWRIFGRFLFLSDLRFTGEGIGFIGYVREIIDLRFVGFAGLLILWGVIGIRFVPRNAARRLSCPVLLAVFVCSQAVAPLLYGPIPESTDWDTWKSVGYEYHEFTSPVYDMAITGPYQFVARDAFLFMLPVPDKEEKYAEINAFFEKRPAHQDNDMTGLFRGKNLIMVQLESIDDFVLNEANTPTLARLQKEGICFSEFYTPQYTAGYTFNTEFSAQTGLYPYANGNVAYTLSRSAFPYTIASQLKKAGYTCRSFHKSPEQFYNRGSMHQAFGYEKYNSALDYAQSEFEAEDDRFLISSRIYADMTKRQPFCNFIITYTGHLGYDKYDALTTYALGEFPEYADPSRPYEINGLFAKARITDEMIKLLLGQLEKDGLLDNTVLCVYDDHYAYGLSERAMLEKYSEDAGGRLLERTPCFIWYKGYGPVNVDKTLQTIDLLPTLTNLFGLEVPKTMGRDAFDPEYEGYVILQHPASWMNRKAYIESGEVQWNNGMSEIEISEMNAYVQNFHEVNDAILDIDYYRELVWPEPAGGGRW